MGKIVHRYVFREILAPFLFGLSVFTFVLLIARMLRLIELVVSRGVPAATILGLIGYIMPAFLEVTLPMAMLLAILVAFGRLSADSEMIALRSSGVSLYQLLAPVALFVVLATAVTAWLSVVARPWGNRSLKTALFEIASTRATAGIRPQIFNDDFPGLVIYAETIDSKQDVLRHVLISDERDEHERSRIFAREARMISDPERQTVTLRLRDGFIHTSPRAGQAEYETDFDAYDVNLDLRETLAAGPERVVNPKELTLAELRATMATKAAAGQPFGPELVEYHRKFSIPFACVVFGLVAVPLGIQPARGARTWGFALSLALILVYYVLLSAGQAAAEQRLVPAVAGLWFPNVAFALLGILLFRRAAREQPVVGLDRLQAVGSALRGRLRTLGFDASA